MFNNYCDVLKWYGEVWKIFEICDSDCSEICGIENVFKF